MQRARELQIGNEIEKALGESRTGTLFHSCCSQTAFGARRIIEPQHCVQNTGDKNNCTASRARSQFHFAVAAIAGVGFRSSPPPPSRL